MPWGRSCPVHSLSREKHQSLPFSSSAFNGNEKEHRHDRESNKYKNNQRPTTPRLKGHQGLVFNPRSLQIDPGRSSLSWSHRGVLEASRVLVRAQGLPPHPLEALPRWLCWGWSPTPSAYSSTSCGSTWPLRQSQAGVRTGCPGSLRTAV